MNVGDVLQSGEAVDIRPGNSLPLHAIPLGTVIHNIELKKGHGAQLIRSAGSFGQLMAKEGKYAQIRMPSTEVRKVLLECKATVGQLGNTEHEIVRIGKAGRNRWKGWRPTVRGLAMNPVDHPHGGGEGKSGQGNPHPVSPWGQPTKGYKTRVNNTPASATIVAEAGSAGSIERMRSVESMTQPVDGTAPPARPVRPPWGTTGTERAWQSRRIVATSTVVRGSATATGCAFSAR